ncbi:type III-A CRISPR-associated protein Cas10/Csm1 [Calorimonas adulescens]|uniref:CRISPR system single-strand-specific deoxyribonuclease Cas10/Csm1 (subtype III-A) n=1 Tax=Calorimonas adulescens TaxID=2606906 RepID=A0A5D8QDL2_9THEO|nr:type III-A CRISPR-associated protein Cas10/Csm1 [Calorimonas adulescens]TZE81603.1 type III-A CRISPR-associated protein Cas10/Csm1 [Calorimonas adulescens]
MNSAQEKLYTASLFHDIGGIVSLIPEFKKIGHAESGSLWARKIFNDEDISNIILFHEDPDKAPDIFIRNLAGFVNNGEKVFNRRHKEDETFGDVNLMSVCTLVNGKAERQYYSEPSYNAVLVDEPAGNGESLFDIASSLSREVKSKDSTYLLNLLRRYTLNLPQLNHTDLRKSFYFHSKFITALAMCDMYYFSEHLSDKLIYGALKDDEKRYLLLQVDYSGIQDTIYTVSSKGALKTIRAKSFYLELLLEDLFYSLLTKFNLPRTNIVINAGGGGILLLPNRDEIKETIDKEVSSLNRFIFDRFGGTLFVSAATLNVSANDLKGDTKDYLMTLADKLNGVKSRKWLDQIDDIFDGVKVLRGDGARLVECPVCHGLFKEEDITGMEVKVCKFCDNIMELGRVIDCAHGFKIADKLYSGPGLPVESYNHKFIFNIPKDEFTHSFDVENTGCIYVFNGSFSTEDSIDNLAGKAIGDKRIGVFRADVDNLGNIFSTTPVDLISYAELSERLSIFFCERLPDKLKVRSGRIDILKGRPMDVNLVYAGGDDLFLIGTWDDVIDAAIITYDEFKKYTGFHNGLNISGGIVLADPDVPIYKLAEISEGAERRAKENESKNSISIFNNVFSWNDFYLNKDSVIAYLNNLLAGADLNDSYVATDYSKGSIQDIYNVLKGSERNRKGKSYYNVVYINYVMNMVEKKNNVKSNLWRDVRHKALNSKKARLLACALEVALLLTRKEEIK